MGHAANVSTSSARRAISPRELRRALDALPSSPGVVARLGALSSDPNATLADYADAVELDANVAARVLRVVNSAYYALPQPIVDIPRGVSFLGTDEVSRIALAVAVVRGLSTARRKIVQEHWRHAVHVALATRTLVTLLAPKLSRDEAWTAGLLHDVGKLVFAAMFDEQAIELAEYARRHKITYAMAETQLGLPCHARLGRVLCERWRLPPIIGQVIELAHDEGSQRHVPEATRRIVRLVAVADTLVQIHEGGLGDEAIAALRDTLLSHLGHEKGKLAMAATAVNDLSDEAASLADMLTAA